MPYRMTIDFDSETPLQIDFPGLSWDELAEQPTGSDRPARVMIDGSICNVEVTELQPTA